MEDTDAQDAWTKPAATFKIKRTVSRGRPSFAPSKGATSQPVKRSNPFGLGSGEAGAGAGARVLGKRPRLEDTLGRRISELRPGQLREDSHDSGLEDSSPPPPAPAGLRAPPLDWSLKSRARLTSNHSFGWTQHLGTAEEASGVTAGVRCLSLARGNHCLDTSLRAQLHAASLYWQHPSLPVPLFPRYSQSSLRSSAAPAPSLSLSPDMHRALHSDWMSSLQSAYQLVKGRQCPYFYLLGPSFTVLFRAAGLAGCQELSALVTPSTSGLRAALRREDVEFTLPLHRPREEEEEEGAGLEEDSATEFLESLGIEADSLPGLAAAAPRHRLAAGHGSSGNIDGRAESLLLVQGVECQSLLNYLLNAKLTLGQGVAALPPTLLAPVAFQGAVLRALKLRQTAVPGRGAAAGTATHAMELTGPLLPTAVQAVLRLATAANPAFAGTLQTAEETVAFCQVGREGEGEGTTTAPSAFASASLGDCGLAPELLAALTARPTGEATVRQVAWSQEEGFTTNTDLDETSNTSMTFNSSHVSNISA